MFEYSNNISILDFYLDFYVINCIHRWHGVSMSYDPFIDGVLVITDKKLSKFTNFHNFIHHRDRTLQI
jgi:hypothetical protein